MTVSKSAVGVDVCLGPTPTVTPRRRATKRLGWFRWEATEELLPYAWVVGYGRTRRSALRALAKRSQR